MPLLLFCLQIDASFRNSDIRDVYNYSEVTGFRSVKSLCTHARTRTYTRTHAHGFV